MVTVANAQSTSSQNDGTCEKQGKVFNGRLASMIGFDKKEVLITKNTEAPLPVDLETGFHAMYLYTDVVEPQLVGNSKVSLLKVIRCAGQFGENVNVSYPKIQYVPVNVKSFETI